MPVDLRTRRQIANASNSDSRIAFGGNGSGGGSTVPSLEPATAPAAVEFGEGGLVTEEAVEGGMAPLRLLMPKRMAYGRYVL
jgi:hypothetical protein